MPLEWLYILLAILALFILLLLCPMGVRIRYGKELCLYVRVGPFDFKVIPKKKKIRISDYSVKAMERAEKKRKKKEEKKKPAPGGAAQAKEKEPVELVKRLKDPDSALDTVELLLDMLSVVLDNFGKRLKVSFACLHVTVGGKDPAKTAVTYGVICSLAGNIANMLSQHTNLEKTKKTSISVVPDFLAEKTAIYADIRLTVRFGQVFTFLFSIRKVIKEIIKLI